MKNLKYALWVSTILLLLFVYWFFFLRTSRENKLIKEGNTLVKKIELFKSSHNRLPVSLDEIGVKEKDGIDALYYDKRDSFHYTIYFGTSLGESKIYYSDNQKWEDFYRVMK